ncbi:MAG: amidohydrolase, partial [Halieaceae bacterium]|nr:amidohydrolase [Halieaceae bacterium]
MKADVLEHPAMKTRSLIWLAMLLCSLLLNVSMADTVNESTRSATLYHSGKLLTMEGDEPQFAEALIEHNGQIVFVGTL